jgi:Mrp family chromosome partitioning ATPase
MELMPEWTGHDEALAPVPPVILPLAFHTNPPGEEVSRDIASDDEHLATDVERFAFPGVRRPRRKLRLGSADKGSSAVLADTKTEVVSPQAIWPKCDCTETVAAGVDMARAVSRQLSSNRSSILAITSPSDDDGKTTLVEVLAPELAKLSVGGVLAVDANFRGAGLTARLTIPAAGDVTGSSLIYPTDLAGLNVLPMSRRRACRAADAAWIEELRESWPLVLLDMPSLEHAEAASMLPPCDGVYLVVRLGHTPRRAVAEAARVIALCGGRLLGCVAVGCDADA